MQDWISTTVLVITFAMLVLNSFITIYSMIQKTKEPTNRLDTRVDNLERLVDSKFKEYDLYFDRDLKRIKELENGNVIIIEALQELLKHAVDGNNVEEMKNCEKKLSRYLIQRGRENN